MKGGERWAEEKGMKKCDSISFQHRKGPISFDTRLFPSPDTTIIFLSFRATACLKFQAPRRVEPRKHTDNNEYLRPLGRYQNSSSQLFFESWVCMREIGILCDPELRP